MILPEFTDSQEKNLGWKSLLVAPLSDQQFTLLGSTYLLIDEVWCKYDDKDRDTLNAQIFVNRISGLKSSNIQLVFFYKMFIFIIY